MPLSRTLSILLLTGGAALSSVAPAAAAAPRLHLVCGIPRHEIVTCRLAGRGFHAREKVRITYTIVFTALPRIHGKPPTKTFHRTAETNTEGSFTRPPLGFAVVKYHESFRLNVTAVGTRGDRARTNLTSIFQ